MVASDSCPTSGGKGLRNSLCTNNCPHCTERHQWDRCHMYGLGIYMGDIAAKSHRYVSRPDATAGGRRRCHLLMCEVVASKVLRLNGHLRGGSVMHDVPSLRAIWGKDLRHMLDFLSPAP